MADLIEEEIQKEVKAHKILIYGKGTKQMPMCGFSGQVVQILDYIGVNFKDINVLEDADIRQGIKDYANWPTIPQLYVKGEFIGGSDIVREMFQSGELVTHLNSQGVAAQMPAKG